jgi:UDP-N-acetylglucosamine diphosphorylase/glucosamine-1-phosphate N-acetyltransferase
MINQILLYENERVDNLYPFSIMHCSFELRLGALLQFERVRALNPKSIINFKGRKNHLASFLKRYNIDNEIHSVGDFLAIDGSLAINLLLFDELNKRIIDNADHSFILNVNNEKAGLFVNQNDFEIFSRYFENTELINLDNAVFNDLPVIDFVSGNYINYLWDALDVIDESIKTDGKLLKHYDKIYVPQFQGVYAEHPGNIMIGHNVKIYPTVVLDGSDGMIIIGNNVKIMPQTTIFGPAYIGNNTIIKVGTKIYHGTAIGDNCKVGGEIENTIIHSYSNKQHEGFLGHSYICQWVNLGADTNNSDLKNTYSNIKIRLPHKTIDSQRIFLGLMCGDHTKSAINTQFNTGTVAGISSILFDSGFLTTSIPSFCWGGSKNSKIYNLDSALETARIVMARRNKELSDEEIVLMTEEFNKINK